LQLNAEAFLWKYRDQQISYFSLDFASGVLINRTANAGRATIKGFDVDVIAKPMANTTLSLQAQYLKTKYTDLHLYTAAPRDNINCPSSIMMSAVRRSSWGGLQPRISIAPAILCSSRPNGR
jgi:iron complex outermembrane receptor protein